MRPTDRTDQQCNAPRCHQPATIYDETGARGHTFYCAPCAVYFGYDPKRTPGHRLGYGHNVHTAGCGHESTTRATIPDEGVQAEVGAADAADGDPATQRGTPGGDYIAWSKDARTDGSPLWVPLSFGAGWANGYHAGFAAAVARHAEGTL